MARVRVSGRGAWGLAIAVFVASALVAARQVPAGPGGARADAPPPTGIIVGTVVDAATGAPVPEAIVGLTASTAPPTARGRMVLTDRGGRFLFTSVARGAVRLTANASGYLSGAAGAVRPNGPPQILDVGDGEHIDGVVIRLFRYGAITGRVTDEAGEPVVGLTVHAFRSALVGGARRLSPTLPIRDPAHNTLVSLNSETDDRGLYRFSPLVPGDYIIGVVSAPWTRPAAGSASDWGNGQVTIGDWRWSLGSTLHPPAPADDGPVLVYPTTFFPASATPANATVVTIASADERAGVDFALRLTPAVRVSGVATGPDGPAKDLDISLLPAGIDQFATESTLRTPTATTSATGTFTFLGVTPGTYTLKVTKIPNAEYSATTTMSVERPGGAEIMSVRPSGPGENPVPTGPTLWAAMPVTVGDTDVTGVTLTLRTGARISGRAEFEGTAPRPSPQTLMRTIVSVEPIVGGIDSGPIDEFWKGQFDASGALASTEFPPGRYFLRPLGAPPGWTVKSVMANGVDAVDTAIDLGATDIAGVVVTFTDRPSRLTGTVRDARSQPDADAAVLVFPADRSAWTNYGTGSRRIKSVRVNRNGVYAVAPLPAGEYFVAAIKDVDAGAWPDPQLLAKLAAVATRVVVDDGQVRSQDLTTQSIR
jgi:uncharacterized protein (DUF2141 family)